MERRVEEGQQRNRKERKEEEASNRKTGMTNKKQTEVNKDDRVREAHKPAGAGEWLINVARSHLSEVALCHNVSHFCCFSLVALLPSSTLLESLTSLCRKEYTDTSPGCWFQPIFAFLADFSK